jgi:uncharacterized membrane protein YtjA (UPF0391 family)
MKLLAPGPLPQEVQHDRLTERTLKGLSTVTRTMLNGPRRGTFVLPLGPSCKRRIDRPQPSMRAAAIRRIKKTNEAKSRRNGSRRRGPQDKEVSMLKWAAIFLVIALIAGALGFSGVAGVAAGIAKVLFFIFLVLFIIALLAGAGLVSRLTR